MMLSLSSIQTGLRYVIRSLMSFKKRAITSNFTRPGFYLADENITSLDLCVEVGVVRSRNGILGNQKKHCWVKYAVLSRSLRRLLLSIRGNLRPASERMLPFPARW